MKRESAKTDNFSSYYTICYGRRRNLRSPGLIREIRVHRFNHDCVRLFLVYIQDVYHYIMNHYITQLIIESILLLSVFFVTLCVLVVQQENTPVSPQPPLVKMMMMMMKVMFSCYTTRVHATVQSLISLLPLTAATSGCMSV